MKCLSIYSISNKFGSKLLSKKFLFLFSERAILL
uniref:Uncharacterized protein n=1 Tax=Siphoviridae sp. ctHip2 TaxID=2827830 RepID=A0A8S5RW54_9CAUD|nr:MAG TPA: hypothetical protein [Siphoviridae sp. ctHip2]